MRTVQTIDAIERILARPALAWYDPDAPAATTRAGEAQEAITAGAMEEMMAPSEGGESGGAETARRATGGRCGRRARSILAALRGGADGRRSAPSGEPGRRRKQDLDRGQMQPLSLGEGLLDDPVL